MLINSFIIGTGCINIVLCGFILFKQYHRNILFLTFLVSILIPLLSYVGSTIFQSPFHPNTLLLIHTYTAISIIITVCICVILTDFIRVTGTKPVSRFVYSKTISWLISALFLTTLCYSLNWIKPAWIGNEYLFILNSSGVVLYSFHFLLTIFVLYTIENVYRFSVRYQKRIGRICLLSIAAMAIFQLLFITRIILFKTITHTYIETATIIFGICYPVFLLGLIRYRLWAEKITITRGTIYASFTLFTTGAVLFGLGISVFLARRLGFSFAYFELFLLLFAGLFFTLLILTSDSMRDRITRAFNEHIYKSKYDYHQQFLRLHETHASEITMQQSIGMLVDNLQYTLTVSNVFVFMLNSEDGNFHIQQNPESRIDTTIRIHGNSPLVNAFDNNDAPLDFTNFSERIREQKVLNVERPFIQSLDISVLFPIMHKERLLGFLAFKRTHGVEFDREDLQFINVFTESIGDVFFKNHLLEERIEHKQFESFNHIASFIIHDIKNQVSTLSLLMKNAASNISNPEFQSSLLHSLKNCVTNLQVLINKFASPPKEEALHYRAENVNEIIQETVSGIPVQSINAVEVQTELLAQQSVQIDKTSFSYIMMNLITNALEAMAYNGTLSITSEDMGPPGKDTKTMTGISGHLINGMKIVIAVRDTGKGMDQDFLHTKLFHPFSSTKDKGIGIGLYQSKVLIEKMGGKIFCRSKVNNGTSFYIYL